MPQFLILGRLAALDATGGLVELGGPKQRELLAILLIRLNEFLPTSRLVDSLWNGEPPAGAAVTVRTHIAHLRRRLLRLGAVDALVTRPAGYALRLEPESLDARRFERLLGLGQEALGLGEFDRATVLLNDALRLWRGPVLDDLGQPGFAAAETARLDELRLVAQEARVDADLALGRHADVVAELEQLVAANPFRERFCGQFMLALYRSGRQVEALAAYAAVRGRLADELGLDVGARLAGLQTAILRHDPALLLDDPLPTASSGRPRRVPSAQQPPDALLAAARRVPLVGRDEELGSLLTMWRASLAGARQVGFLSGEAGIGKTRLVAELAHRVASEDCAVLIGRCDRLTGVAYRPIAEALRASPYARQILADAPQAIADRLGPISGRQLSPDTADQDRRDDGGDARDALFDAVGWLLARIAARGALLLIVDDAERIDSASSRLIRRLVTGLPDGVLLVVCFRDPPGTGHGPLLELLGDVESRGMAHRVALSRLTEVDIAELAAGVYGGRTPDQVVRQLWRRSGGNPFFATELARELIAVGEPGEGSQERVPIGVRDVLRQRLHALSGPAQQVIAVAAVIGRESEFGQLAGLVDGDEELVIDALNEAVAAGFLVDAGRSWAAGYAFCHELTRDAAYADIPLPRRQRLHARIARMLLTLDPIDHSDLVAAAAHLRAAGPLGDPRQAAEVSLRAAEQAALMYAWDEAVAHAESAVEVLGRARTPAAAQGRAMVRAALLRTKSGIGYPRAIQLLESALDEYRLARDDEAAAGVHSRLGGALCSHHSVMDITRALEHFATAERLLGDSVQPFHLYRGRAQAAMFGLRTDLLGAASGQAAELARSVGRRDLAVLADWGQAWYSFNCGELARARDVFAAMWATADDYGDAYLGWPSVNAAALCATAYLLDPASGRAWCRRGLAQPRLRTLQHPHTTVLDQLVLAQATMGDLAAARSSVQSLPLDAVGRRLLRFLDGDWEGAEAAWALALSTDEATGDRHDAALNARWLAAARLRLGRTDAAIDLLQRALVVAVDGPQVPTELAVRADLASLLASQGDAVGATEHLRRCAEILGAGEDWRGLAGVVEAARGALAATQHDVPTADAAFDNAVRILTLYDVPWHRAEALDRWARALTAAGEPERAATRYQAAAQVYDQIGAAARWRDSLAI